MRHTDVTTVEKYRKSLGVERALMSFVFLNCSWKLSLLPEERCPMVFPIQAAVSTLNANCLLRLQSHLREL